jgi:hypothetical protein
MVDARRRKTIAAGEEISMRGRRQPVWVLAGLFMLLAAAAAAQTPELKTIEFTSPAVGRTMKYFILLPPDLSRSRPHRRSSQRAQLGSVLRFLVLGGPWSIVAGPPGARDKERGTAKDQAPRSRGTNRLKPSASLFGNWLAAPDDFRNWLILEAA